MPASSAPEVAQRLDQPGQVVAVVVEVRRHAQRAAALRDLDAARTGRDLARLDYYVGFNRWKSAAIVHGVYARYLEGKKSSEGVDLVSLKERMVAAIDLAEMGAELGAGQGPV